MIMAPTLEDKLALLVSYLNDLKLGHRAPDQRSFSSLLDDAELADWLDRMRKSGRIINTRFLR